MDSESPPFPSFELKPDTWVIDRVVLFSGRSGAEAFLREVFPFFSNCLVASADGAYPRDPRLRAKVWEAFEGNERLRVVVLGYSAMKTVRLKTNRIFVVDEILMQDFKRHPSERSLAFHFSPEKMAFFLEAYFGQWEKMERLGNMEFAFTRFSEYDQSRFDWRAEILGLKTDL